jgi:hypothetical protein
MVSGPILATADILPASAAHASTIGAPVHALISLGTLKSKGPHNSVQTQSRKFDAGFYGICYGAVVIETGFDLVKYLERD